MRRGLAVLGSIALVASLGLAAPTVAQANDAPSPRVAPTAAAPITGTPAEILQEIPVTEPLTVGYKAGLFLPVGAMKEKDKRGCTLRNQLLIQLASKKPKVGKKCKLTGGEWKVDFGTKTIKKPGQVKLGTLLPDKYVYAQGAYGWTEKQREIYAENYAPAKSLTGSNRAAVNGLFTNSTQQAFSSVGIKRIIRFHNVLSNTAVEQRGGDQRDAQVAAELDALRAQNPEFFDSWTVATLLNAKSWGLSFTPGTNANFQVTIEECSQEEAPKGEQNPCSTTYSVPNEAAKYNITAVPQTASLVPPTVSSGSDRSSVPNLSYQAPTGDPIDRFLFGIHAPANWVSDVATGFEGPIEEATIPNVPVGYVRLWDTETTWADVEPQKGQFDFRKLDKQIEMAQILDARVMLVLGMTPSWAGDSPQSMPRNIQDWRDYVSRVACRFGPSIASFEIWNEANLSTFWTGTPDQMADLTAAAFEEIRGCGNSGALVVAANTTSRATGSFGTFYPEYLQGLKARNWPVDAYSVHSYPTASGGANDRIRGIGQFRTMLAAAGAPQTTVFDTEINYGLAGLGEGKVDLTGENAMALMSRTYIDSVRYGFGSTFWFVWTANPDSKFGIQFTRAATAEQTAWRTTYDWLVGAQFQRCVETDDQVVICQFNKGSDNFSIIWRGEVGAAAGQVPSSIVGQLGSRKCDLFTNCDVFGPGDSVTVGPMPIRIDGAPLPASTDTGGGNAEPGPVTDSSFQPAAPSVSSVELVYGPSNKADATATFAPPSNFGQWRIERYEYQWKYCESKCRVISRGTADPFTTRIGQDLINGPGKYQFAIRAVGTVTRGTSSGDTVTSNVTSPWATRDFTVLSSRAAPPGTVEVAANTTVGIVSWNAPTIRKIAGYQVQVRNVTGNGRWRSLPQTDATQMEFTPAFFGLKAGDEVQARVRTVLTDDQRSVYVASPVMKVVGQLPTDKGGLRFADENICEASLFFVQKPQGLPGDFPDLAAQFRVQNADGTWTLMTYKSRSAFERLTGGSAGVIGDGTDTPEASNTTLFPIGVWATGVNEEQLGVSNCSMALQAEMRYEYRLVSGSGDFLPSEWRRVQLFLGI